MFTVPLLRNGLYNPIVLLCLAPTTLKTSHVLAISPVHWHSDCCLATTYKHLSCCCVTLSKKVFIALLPSSTRYNMNFPATTTTAAYICNFLATIRITTVSQSRPTISESGSILTLSRALSLSLWLYSPLDLGGFFSFLMLYTDSKTPWTGDQPVARPLPTHRTT
jgi:hypothetical protein